MCDKEITLQNLQAFSFYTSFSSGLLFLMFIFVRESEYSLFIL